MKTHLRLSHLLLTAVVLHATASTPRAQEAQAWDAMQFELPRSELQAMLENYQRAAQSQAYSAEMKERAQQQARLIQSRLEGGDFRVGDAIALIVDGETLLSNTFSVQPGPSMSLPTIGRLSLRGVLRSELEQHLEAEIGKFIRDPVIRAQASVRLAVTGNVNKPGYLFVSTNTPISDVVTLAGGLAAKGQLQRSWIERDNHRIWDGAALQEALATGRTVDQMSLQAGDRLVVPEEKDSWIATNMRTLLMSLGSIVVLLGALGG